MFPNWFDVSIFDHVSPMKCSMVRNKIYPGYINLSKLRSETFQSLLSKIILFFYGANFVNLWNPSNFYILDECCLRKWQITMSVVVYNTWCWSKYWQLRVVFSCESCEWFSSAGTIRHHHHYSHRLIIDKWSAGHRRCVTFLMNRPISRISLHTALQSAAATETCLSNGRLILIMKPVQLTSAGYWATPSLLCP